MTNEARRNYWLGRWAKALRARGHEQCIGAMHPQDGRFCAVGVFYDELCKDGLVGEWEAWHTRMDALVGQGLIQIAEYRNDFKRSSFAEIADWLESQMGNAPDLPEVEGEVPVLAGML